MADISCLFWKLRMHSELSHIRWPLRAIGLLHLWSQYLNWAVGTSMVLGILVVVTGHALCVPSPEHHAHVTHTPKSTTHRQACVFSRGWTRGRTRADTKLVSVRTGHALTVKVFSLAWGIALSPLNAPMPLLSDIGRLSRWYATVGSVLGFAVVQPQYHEHPQHVLVHCPKLVEELQDSVQPTSKFVWRGYDIFIDYCTIRVLPPAIFGWHPFLHVLSACNASCEEPVISCPMTMHQHRWLRLYCEPILLIIMYSNGKNALQTRCVRWP